MRDVTTINNELLEVVIKNSAGGLTDTQRHLNAVRYLLHNAELDEPKLKLFYQAVKRDAEAYLENMEEVLHD